VEDDAGVIVLSKRKADRIRGWEKIITDHKEGDVVTGRVMRKIKGGLLVDIGVPVFLPASQVNIRRPGDIAEYIGKEVTCKILKIDEERRNIVVSRRKLIEEEREQMKAKVMAEIQVGQRRKGVVKNIADFGAFVDLGGIDGLLHITDMAWRRVKHPAEVVEIGQEIKVKVLKFDRDRQRVSLGLKQMGEDPWVNISRRYPEHTRVFGKVTNIADYGCFVEIEEGVEGLVHVSEMDWTNKNIHPSKVVNLGDEVEVMVLDIDEERRRISLGIKQCAMNPWDEFGVTHKKGDHVSGKIKSITDFGIFIGLDGGIDGLVHLSDISWDEPGEQALRRYKKGDELETVVLSVDPERERISLGVKQLDRDPFSSFVAIHEKGSFVVGAITELDAKGATISLGDGVEGYLRASEISRDRVEDARAVLKLGDEIEAKFMGVDRKNRTISLSIKAKDQEEEQQAIKGYARDISGGATTLGDLLREQMEEAGRD
ncbi:30S ribosomal protein S1, partial [uncultured Thiodictyon sp.]|uniref:30S ribosomal protein S1 n=1 Tax=uncultured Thiodictyon sp. TaxID=1846217 RepID=UPI0025CF6564